MAALDAIRQTLSETGCNHLTVSCSHIWSGKQNLFVAAFWGLDVILKSALDSVGIIRAAHGRKKQGLLNGMKERLELCLALLSRPKFFCS